MTILTDGQQMHRISHNSTKWLGRIRDLGNDIIIWNCMKKIRYVGDMLWLQLNEVITDDNE